MHRNTILSIAIAFVAPSPHGRATSLSVSSPQADGVVDASAFLRRAYHSSVVLDGRLYIDGGEFSFSKTDGIAYESSNSLISIDLAQDWTIGSVTFDSDPKPPQAPSLIYGGIWVDRKAGVLYTGFAGTTPSFGDTAPSPQGLWSFTPDGAGAGSWRNLNKTADPSFMINLRPFQGQAASGRGVGFYLGGGNVGTATATQQQHPVGSFSTYDFSSGEASSANLLGVSGPAQGGGHSGGVSYVSNFGNRGILVSVGKRQDRRENDNGLVDFQTVQVYDVDNQQWFEQQTTGDIPQPRKEFCIAGAPSNNRTYEMLVYAGWDGHFGSAATPYDSAFVLTLPGFYWVKANYPAKHPRHGLTCNAVGGGQILTIGGVDTAQQQDGGNETSKAGFNTADPFTQGLAIFYLGGLTWSSTYLSTQGPQPPAPRIQQYYNDQGRQPLNGFTTPELATLFSITDFSDSSEGSSSSSSAASARQQSSHTRTIVGTVLGGAAGIATAAILILYFLRRRRRRRAEAAMAKAMAGGGVKDVDRLSSSPGVSEGVTLAPTPVEIEGVQRLEMEVQERPCELSEEAAILEMPGSCMFPVELPA